MRRPLPPTVLLLLALQTLAAAPLGPPAVPAELRVAAGQQLVLTAHARGVQIYLCSAGAWTLKAPDAELRDEHGVLIGHHAAGPTWQLNDGSAVTGKAVAHVDAPDGKSIPWLLLSVTAHTGTGALSPVSAIQRLHTRGGMAPAEPCTGAPPAAERRVAYRADYYFYAPSASP
jgi:hypothetical protein